MPTKALGTDSLMSPHESANKTKPDMSRTRQWGSKVIVKLKKRPKAKLSERGEEVRWIGVSSDTLDGSIVYWPSKGKVSIERDIVGLETTPIEGEMEDETTIDAISSSLSSTTNPREPQTKIETNAKAPESKSTTSVDVSPPKPPSTSSAPKTTSNVVGNDPVAFIEGINDDGGVEDELEGGEEDGEIGRAHV